MENREREMLDELRDMAEEIQVPEGLTPDAVEKKLLEVDERKSARKRRRILTVGLAAACCLLVCGAVYRIWSQQNAGGGEGFLFTEDRKTDGVIETAESYKEVYKYAKRYEYYGGGDDAVDTGTEMTTSDSMTEAADGASEDTKTSSAEYSDTNVRQEGVDEGDVVKTDGRYLFTLAENRNKIAVIDTQNGLAKAGEIRMGEYEYICEFYIRDGKAIVILRKDWYSEADMEEFYYFQHGSTTVRTYDLQDISQPELIGEVTQSGDYSSSRISGEYLYLFSQYYISEMEKDIPETFIPVIAEKTIPEEDIYLPEEDSACMYELVTAIHLENPGEVADSKAILGKGGELYVSGQNIYWYETEWESGWSGKAMTNIRKLSYQDGRIEAVAQGEIPGYINDSFSIDEYNGYLRIVTTNEDTNGVYVLNEKMETVGTIEGLAQDERVYSARFFGDTGYFVTFRETDPLFSVDLSDPQNPQIVGELKIPGFSEYLHPYGENQLLGIGMAADEETGITDGVKLSMFDISDRTDVKENNVFVMENVYSTDVFYNYKAVVIDSEKNLIGFSGYTEGGETYFVFSYDAENGFVCRLQEMVNGNSYAETRGVYIGDVLYIVKGNIIEAYDLNSYSKVGDIII